jgi:hypothetical protein
MEGFTSLCISLASCYIFFVGVSLFQLGRIVEREQGGYDPRAWLWPVTVQQQVHLLTLLLSSVRVAFFFVAMVAWDSDEGVVKPGHKVEFYSLDEFATVLFFTLASVLALFWAELYYISTDSPETFSLVVKPWTYVVNGAAYIAVAIITALVSTTFEDDVDYMFMDYTILAATVYFLAAAMFAHYAWRVASELKEVPIGLPTRRNRLKVLRYLAAIVIMALLVKAIVLIAITGKPLHTASDLVVVGVFFYYLLLELAPLAVILAFYRVEGAGSDDDYDYGGEEDEEGGGEGGGGGKGGLMGGFEGDALLAHYYQSPPSPSLASGASGGGGGGRGRSNRRTVSPMRTMPRFDAGAAPQHVVDQIIARLSGLGPPPSRSGGSGEVGAVSKGSGDSTDGSGTSLGSGGVSLK